MALNLSESLVHEEFPYPSEKVPLCAVCQACINGRFELAEQSGFNNEYGLCLDHHHTVASFQASVNQECHVCVALWQSIPSSEIDTFLKTTFRKSVTQMAFLNLERVVPSLKPEPDTIDMVLYIFDCNGETINLGASFSLEASKNLDVYRLHATASNNMKSDESLSLAREWYKECTTTHLKCNEMQSCKGWFPSRLIDIGLSANCMPRLLVTSETPPTGPYVTLSHRWGSAQFIQLTSKSLDRMKQNILMSELPQVFIDTIYVARYLGFRYIWIDSLCIIQDSTTDWLDEALLMNLVYSNSMCNIAANGVGEGSEGLFRERTVHNLYPCEITMSSDGIQEPLEYHIIDTSWWDSQINQTPLNRRAWVVQERFLAPRVIHFGVQQLLWECRELDAAEKYPRGLPPNLKQVSGFKSFEPAVGIEAMKRFSGRNWDDSYNFNMLWNKIVNLYSSSQLTNPADKVIALSGIAKMLGSIMNDEYIVGLWKEYFPSQLCWYVEDCRQSNGEPSVRPPLYVAPSWSWLSVDGVVKGTGWTKNGSLIDILEINISSQTSDTTGPVKSGSIRIKGNLKNLRLVRGSKNFNPWETYVNGIEICADATEIGGGKSTIRPPVYLDVDKENFTDELYLMCLQDDEQHLETVLSESLGFGERYFHGMILEPTGIEAGEFRRLGVLRAGVSRHIDLILTSSKESGTIPCESYDTTTGKHTIRIV